MTKRQTRLDGGLAPEKAFLTPKPMLEALEREFGPMFDPCPYPRAPWDGLRIPWKAVNYVNPPFSTRLGSNGCTPWVRKALLEHAQGKTVVMVLPVRHPEGLMIEGGAIVRGLEKRGRYWLTPSGKVDSISSDTALFVLE